MEYHYVPIACQNTLVAAAFAVMSCTVEVANDKLKEIVNVLSARIVQLVPVRL